MGLLNFEWIRGQKRESGGTPLLQIEHVCVRIGQRLVLDDVSLDVFEGEQVRITGPNGAGKSTLFNAITGVLPLNEGRILFRGEDISKLPTHERTARGIRYMRQRDNVFPSLTVRENLQLAVGREGYERFREKFPEWAKDISANQSSGMLSGGQKQKLAWGMVVLSSGNIILADEPSAGVAADANIMSQSLPTAIFIEHD
ncbi:ATP-binding cassette domain-containing protein [Methylobacter sp.]|uniref:ATP-binding cassette domain-containing protein n=1 Tax=Methylobacter sp. TaxID=2051955 RepID=UPI002FDE371E